MPRHRHAPKIASEGQAAEIGVGRDARRLHSGGPRRARTDDPRIKSPMLYQLS